MRTELVYLWINQDKNNCLKQMGFNFSPRFNVKFDEIQKLVSIKKTDDINIFDQNNLMNLTAVVGENGTGKTALLQYLTSLTYYRTDKDSPEYESWQVEQNKLEKFIAVYCKTGESENIEVINNSSDSISIDSALTTIIVDGFQASENISQISHVLLSNSEYTENNNLRSNVVNYITLTNHALRTISTTFYEKLFCLDAVDYKHQALQSIISHKMSVRNFQAVLDLKYQGYILDTELMFCGKTINVVSTTIESLLKMIQEKEQVININTEFASREYITKFHSRAKQEISKISDVNCLVNVLITNLLCELVYLYDFGLEGENLSIDSVYQQCKTYIENLIEAKSYYSLAIEEIDDMKLLVSQSDTIDNLLPKTDLGFEQFIQIKTKDLSSLVSKWIKKERSFVLKYLRILNFEMSSGERALLDLVSRLYFASDMSSLIPNDGFKLQENVLLLIDEIDLYLHPEWQRRIISDLINEIKKHFPTNCFQLVITSHSPIVLSDIPRENCIFLRKTEGITFQVDRDLQTFGANIHTLYKDAFFIKNGLAMGAYAQEFIDKLISDISGNIIDAEVDKKISIIGEPILKKKIQQLLGAPQVSMFPMPEDERQKMIEFLKKQKSDIDRQLAILERNIVR